jgi:hypothetical protein
MAQDNFTIEVKIIDTWGNIITLDEFVLCEIGTTLYLFQNDN